MPKSLARRKKRACFTLMLHTVFSHLGVIKVASISLFGPWRVPLAFAFFENLWCICKSHTNLFKVVRIDYAPPGLSERGERERWEWRWGNSETLFVQRSGPHRNRGRVVLVHEYGTAAGKWRRVAADIALLLGCESEEDAFLSHDNTAVTRQNAFVATQFLSSNGASYMENSPSEVPKNLWNRIET